MLSPTKKRFFYIILCILIVSIGGWIGFNFLFKNKIFDFYSSTTIDSSIFIQIDRSQHSDRQISSVLSSSSLIYKDDMYLRFKVQDSDLLKLQAANINFVQFPSLSQGSSDKVFLVTIKEPLTDSKTQTLANYGSIIFNYPLKENSFLIWGDSELGSRIARDLEIVDYSGELLSHERFAPQIFSNEIESDDIVAYNIKYLLTKNDDANTKLNNLKKTGLELVGRLNTRFINEQYDVLDIQVKGTFKQLLEAMRINPEIFFVYSIAK